MKLFEQIIDKLGYKQAASQPASSADDTAAGQLLDKGQWAKRAGKLDEALSLLNEAQAQADAAADHTAQSLITLHRAEILISVGRYDEAEQMLLRMRHEAQHTGQHVQLAYALCTLGTWAQAQDDWEEARAYYEQALKVAQAAGSMGGEGRALGYLADTYLHENNASYAVHLLRDALPKLNLSGDIEFSSYFVGKLGLALIETGHDSEGERLLYRALRLAEQMKYRIYERRWALALARRTSSDMRYEESFRLYQRVLKLMDTSPDTDLKVTTLCEASRICLYLGDLDTARDYAKQALEVCETGSCDLLPLAKGVLGMALKASSRDSEAIPYLEQSLENLVTVDTFNVEIRRSLAAARADAGDTGAAVLIYKQVLELTGQQMPMEQAQTHLELGLIYEQQQEMQLAIAEWKAALAIYEGERYFAQAARLYCDIGGARRFLGQRAMKDYEQALMMLSSVDDLATRGVVVSNAAVAYADLGDTESAEAFFDEAIDIAQRLNDRAAEATRRGNYGWFLLSTGRPQRAIVTLEQALRLSRQEGLNLQVAVQMDNLGLAHDTLGEYDRALEFHRAALEKIRTENNNHWENLIKVNLASTLTSTGQLEQARPLLQQALTAGRDYSDAEVIVRALIGQVRAALLDKHPHEAGGMLDEAIYIARRADMRRQLAEALQLQSEQQAALDRPDRSLTLWDEAQKLFTIMQMPQADLQPDWLHEPVEG